MLRNVTKVEKFEKNRYILKKSKSDEKSKNVAKVSKYWKSFKSD